MLEVSHVSKKYRGCQQALEDVSLSVGPGEIVGIFGPNGAGKTTLLKCILGLLRYGFGSVTLDGQPITPKNIARLSFATCEHSFFPGLTAAGHRDFCAEHFPAFRAGRFQMLMDFFRLPEKRALRGFSTGQKNQFEVILALSPTMEGDTTNFYIFRKLAPYHVKVSILARGVSIGDELEYTDEVTLGRSIINRLPFDETFHS